MPKISWTTPNLTSAETQVLRRFGTDIKALVAQIDRVTRFAPTTHNVETRLDDALVGINGPLCERVAKSGACDKLVGEERMKQLDNSQQTVVATFLLLRSVVDAEHVDGFFAPSDACISVPGARRALQAHLVASESEVHAILDELAVPRKQLKPQDLCAAGSTLYATNRALVEGLIVDINASLAGKHDVRSAGEVATLHIDELDARVLDQVAHRALTPLLDSKALADG